LAALAAKKPTDRFTKQFAKSTPLTLSDSTFTSLTKAPRDYSIAVLLTALESRFGCAACQEFHPEWDILARSWQKGDKKGDSRLLMGTLDFLDGKGTFQSLGLQHAPVLLLFNPTTGPNARADAGPVRYDFTAGTQSADAVRSWLVRHLPAGPHPPVLRPFNYLKFVIGMTAFLGIVTFATVAAPYVWPIMQNRNLWAAISLIAVLLFTSGQMFNHIRHTPYAGGDANGGVSVFAGGFQNQFGLETQIIAGICEFLMYCYRPGTR
jgi:oligosaccharyltransferase complex subunit gamma